jgi:proteasome lid subunit RPN8/RPN11
MSAEFLIPKSIWKQMQHHVEEEAPLEACGILGGQEWRAIHIIPVQNIYKSQTRFKMNPQAQLEAFNQLENLSCDLIAIYHSHPRGKSYPSKEDIDQAFYPDAVQLIWSVYSNYWRCCAYFIKNRMVEEIEIRILDEE